MRLSFLPLVALVGSTIAIPLQYESKRDIRAITYNINRVTDALKPLYEHLERRSSGRNYSPAQFFEHAIELNARVVREMQLGAIEIRRAPAPWEYETVGLTSYILPMVNAARNCADAWPKHRRDVPNRQVQNQVLDTLAAAASQMTAFADAINSKVGIVRKIFGEEMKQSVNYKMESAISAYSR